MRRERSGDVWLAPPTSPHPPPRSRELSGAISGDRRRRKCCTAYGRLSSTTSDERCSHPPPPDVDCILRRRRRRRRISSGDRRCNARPRASPTELGLLDGAATPATTPTTPAHQRGEEDTAVGRRTGGDGAGA